MSEASSISADQMRMVLEVARLLAVTGDLDALLTQIAMSATALLKSQRASIFLHDAGTGELWTRVALGAKEIRVPDTMGICGHVFHTNKLLNVARPYEDARFNREIDRQSGFVTRNLLTAPTRDMQRKANGVLQVVNREGGTFSASDEAMIEMLADQAGVAIQRHYLQEQAVEAGQLRHEMELAHRVQAAMSPESAPKVEGLEAAGWTRPASVTGGDCFDLWEMPDGRMGIFLGDASGHGIGPAIVVSQARTLCRALGELRWDPTWVLKQMNARLAQDLEAGRFVTVFVGCVSRRGLLKWSSAGHGPIFLRTARGKKFELLEPLAPPIGVLPDLPCDEAATVQLESGGTLVVMSDGVYEARSRLNELYEVRRVLALLNENAEKRPEEMVSAVKETIRGWQGKEEPTDDQTMVVVRRV